MSIFTSKILKIFDKNSDDKIWSQNDKEIKVSPLMPIRVNGRNVSFPGRKIEQHNKEQITIILQEGQGEVLFRALQKT